MSIHYFIHMKHPENFSKAGFEAYCKEFGLQATIPESFSLAETPDNTMFTMFIDDQRFTRGRESSTFSLNIVVDPGASVVSPRHKPLSFWDKLRKNRRVAFRAAIEDTKTVWRLCGCLYSLIDPLPIFFLAGYLVRACGGIFETPDENQFYLNSQEIDPVVAQILEEMREMAQRGELKV